MSLIVALGSNIGDRLQNLHEAKKRLEQIYSLVRASHIYESEAVDYTDQPSFYNQVIEFQLPESQEPDEVVQKLLDIEAEMGREREIPLGPRTIDLDLIFYGLQQNSSTKATVPHPRVFERAFVVFPLKELPFFETLKKKYTFPEEFDHEASALEN